MAGEITVGGNILASHTGVEGAGSLTLGNTVAPAYSHTFRNKIINGNFDIWQRGTSQTHGGGGYGCVDRWRPGRSNSTIEVYQQSFNLGQTEVPGNPKYYVREVVTSVSGSGSQAILQHRIEDVSTLSGKTATLSFWAKADETKNIATDFFQNFGTGGTPSSTVYGIGSTTHNLTTSWQKFTTTFSIPSMSGKIIGTDRNHFAGINFWLEAGSDWDDRTNSLGQQSGTFDIAQVQLEEGPVATPFEQRPYDLELSLCQRYYQQLWLSCISRDYNRRAHIFHSLTPNMRKKPTAKVYSGRPEQTLNKVSYYSSGAEVAVESISYWQPEIAGVTEGVPIVISYVQCPSGSTFSTQPLWGRFTFDAEL